MIVGPQDGKGYVLEKVQLTRSKDLRNAGGFFIRALEKDYREPVTNTKPAPPPKKKRVEPQPQEPQATDEERAQTSAKLREFIKTLRTSTQPFGRTNSEITSQTPEKKPIKHLTPGAYTAWPGHGTKNKYTS
jgi:hypothetical protein